MSVNALFLVNSVALGFGLAMDAFSVSLVNGLSEPRMKRSRQCLIAGVYAVFQFVMPLIGWLCVRTIAQVFTVFQQCIPWIALILLVVIGLSMLLEGKKDRKKEKSGHAEDIGHGPVSFGTLMLQGVATSIDALSVGFTIAEYGIFESLIACLVIALVTFALCYIALFLGRKIGTKLTWRAQYLGGIILIAIGIEIFVTGILS